MLRRVRRYCWPTLLSLAVQCVYLLSGVHFPWLLVVAIGSLDVVTVTYAYKTYRLGVENEHMERAIADTLARIRRAARANSN